MVRWPMLGGSKTSTVRMSTPRRGSRCLANSSASAFERNLGSSRFHESPLWLTSTAHCQVFMPQCITV